MLNLILLNESFWPTTAEGWAGVVTFLIGFLGAVIALIPVSIKLVKRGKELIKNKNWATIKEIADAAMKKAEETGKTGAEKKEIVISAVAAGCEEAGIAVDEKLLQHLADYIDATIDWVNGMTKAKKDKSQPVEDK